MSGRTVRARLTGDDLVNIEVRARVVGRRSANAQQQAAIARQVCIQDVPDLLAEIRRLRGELQEKRRRRPAGQGDST